MGRNLSKHETSGAQLLRMCTRKQVPSCLSDVPLSEAWQSRRRTASSERSVSHGLYQNTMRSDSSWPCRHKCYSLHSRSLLMPGL